VTSRGCAFYLRVSPAGWGATADVVVVQLLLGDAVAGETLKQGLAVTADGALEVRMGDALETALCTSAPGALPLGEWHHVCYSAALWNGEEPQPPDPQGRCDVYVDGVPVTGVADTTTVGAGSAQQTGQRIGNCADDGNAVTVAIDDYCNFSSFETVHPEQAPPFFATPHAVFTRFPVAAGDATELGAVGAGENWACCAEPLADGDTTRVEKGAGDARDLYHLTPWPETLPALPVDVEDAEWEQFAACCWGLLRDDGGLFEAGSLLVRYEDAFGGVAEYSNRQILPADGAYAFIETLVGQTQPELDSLQVGWGMAAGDVEDALEDAFAGSQVVVEVWYPAPPVPPPVSAGRKWRIRWVD
jgi:hypothetical protein